MRLFFFLFFFLLINLPLLWKEKKPYSLNKLCVGFMELLCCPLHLAQQWLFLGMTHPGRHSDLLKLYGSEKVGSASLQ